MDFLPVLSSFLRLDRIVKEYRERSLIDREMWPTCCGEEEVCGLVFGRALTNHGCSWLL